ncbi:MAG TPA: ATP-dependent DNA helicase RecG [Candidatus Acidoferrales bacterium]
MDVTLNTPILGLRGIGPQRGSLLAESGFHRVADLLQYLPFRYEDRIRFTPIAEVIPGEFHTVLCEVTSGSTVRFARDRNAMFLMKVRDASGILSVRFFHGAYLEGRLKPGTSLVLHGKVDLDPYRTSRREMINPQVEVLSASQASASADSTEVGRIVPIYEAIGGISSRMIRRLIYGLLQNLSGDIPETLPPELLSRYGLPSRREALMYVHFPPANEDLEMLNSFRSPAHARMIFEEFFFFQLGIAARRKQEREQKGIPLQVRDDRIRAALKRILPFKPTAAQKKVLAEIAADLEQKKPMSRLLEGDVGSGKTIVALEAAVIAMENGCQVALMAPTEILAVQHYLSAGRIFKAAGYRVELLVSGMKRSDKTEALARIRSGQAQFIAGTHALIEDPVEFSRLGLVIVDEQHRFGVLQRKRLMDKGASPHVLVMTATPIPRTLALTVYGDLDLSVIDEMPPGRTPVQTRWNAEEQLPGVWEFLRREISKGRQAYIIYPVIDESKQELKAATAEFERLSRDVFPNLCIGLLHGRLPSEEKEDVMERFRRRDLQILVATTVIEVGVDVPNATVMVIEHADRFGLAQLHQLRGRIGRGTEKSSCILVAPKNILGDARERIETMVATTNGFEIAERDLKQRGPGEFFGTRQHGDLEFHVAHPLRDHKLLELARTEAFALSDDPARAEELRKITAQLGTEWFSRYRLAAVG